MLWRSSQNDGHLVWPPLSARATRIHEPQTHMAKDASHNYFPGALGLKLHVVHGDLAVETIIVLVSFVGLSLSRLMEVPILVKLVIPTSLTSSCMK